MTRRKKKANHGDHIDRISDLPSNVIDGILKHLPIEDVVRTSILSRKWRYMWVSVPRLEFGNDFFEKYKSTEIPSIITEVLLIHNAPVSKFTVNIPYNYPIRIRCLDKWILALSRSGINDLELVNLQAKPYQMPSHLFSCQELTYLELHNFQLSLPPNFCGFKSLLGLSLDDIRFESSALESLISGCPVLNRLIISFCSGFDYINVSAPSLKVLHIVGPLVIKSICFKNAENLIELTIMHIPWENFEKVSVSDFFKGLPKIERLCLGEGYIKILSAGIIPETLQMPINSLKYLELDGVDFNESRELLFIVCLLKSCPNLVELVIKTYSLAVAPRPDDLKVLDCNSCCLSQLRKVNIKVKTVYEHALDLIRFLLANSSSLEILTFNVGLSLKRSDAPKLLSISRDLLQMERASQRAEVKFLYDGLPKQ